MGIQLGGFLLGAVSICFLVTALVLSYFTRSFMLAGLSLLFWLTSLIILSYLINVANQIYRCALYLYASQGVIANPFSQNLMTQAWKIKK